MTTCEINVTERVSEILQEYLGINVTFSPGSDLLNDLGMDSLEQIELGLKLEKDFSIRIAVTDLRGCVTVEDVIQLVVRIIAQKEAKDV